MTRHRQHVELIRVQVEEATLRMADGILSRILAFSSIAIAL